MKKKANYFCAVLVTSILVAFVAFGRSSSNGSGPERTENRSAFQVCSGTIEVAVQITNEDGEPLSEVSVVASSTKHGAGGFTTESKRERAVVDGFFHITKTEICNLRLNLTKPGYFGETLDYTVMKNLSLVEDISDLSGVVVLKQRPTPAPMKRIEGILKTNVKGPTTAIKLQPGTRDASNVEMEKAGGLDSLGGYCFLDFRIDDGRIDSVPRKSQSGGVYHEPKGASLRSTRLDDGFILFKPQNEHPIAERAFREMRVAPEAGYVPELEFPRGSGDRVYFYCFLGGLYGKGFIVRPSLRDDNGETTAVSVVKILVNPTGDTNVATID